MPEIDALDLVLGTVFDDGVKLGKYGKQDASAKAGRWIKQGEWDREKSVAVLRARNLLKRVDSGKSDSTAYFEGFLAAILWAANHPAEIKDIAWRSERPADPDAETRAEQITEEVLHYNPADEGLVAEETVAAANAALKKKSR